MEVSRFEEIMREHVVDQFDMERELSNMGIDSLGTIDLILDLEDAFDIEFPDEYLNEESFKNGNSIWGSINEIIKMKLDR
ncbi:phosphopantetheine-binding protein [Bacillus alkalicellulosilyticus]|uniref:phosphopantetheine-binding protein n=1 Tax=Alkalihalobacterium alkalicellulosilyticum TaxID=1912214 RepID=UPI0009980ACB|nr:phosphopantetheine-binding protein [Bacillus alkalicellulosilyticus]